MNSVKQRTQIATMAAVAMKQLSTTSTAAPRNLHRGAGSFIQEAVDLFSNSAGGRDADVAQVEALKALHSKHTSDYGRFDGYAEGITIGYLSALAALDPATATSIIGGGEIVKRGKTD